MWCNPSTGEERQANLCETEPSLVYVVSYRPAGATEKLCLKKQTSITKTKKGEGTRERKKGRGSIWRESRGKQTTQIRSIRTVSHHCSFQLH